MGRRPKPRLRNFFEKKFLKDLQKTLKRLRRDSGDAFDSPRFQ